MRSVPLPCVSSKKERRGGCAVHPGPIEVNGFGGFHKVLENHRLYQEGVGAFAVGASHVAIVRGRSEDDYWQHIQAGLASHPLQDFKAGLARDFQIEQKQAGEWIAL